MPRSSPLIPLQDPLEAERGELVLPGKSLSLPLVHRVTVIHSQQASRISWHSHHCLELLFLAEGATSYEFQNDQSVDLPGGYFLAIPQDVRHRGLQEVRHPVHLLGVMIEVTRKNSGTNTPFTASDLSWMSQQFQKGALVSCRMSAELKRSVRILAQQVRSTHAPSRLDAAAMRINLCATILSAARELTARRQTEPSRAVNVAVEYLNQNYSKRIQMQALANVAGCSRARLYQIFKESTGLAPNDYLLRLRIKQAQTALTSSMQPITTIALQCGFTTSQYFSNVFRKYTGFTPSAYRSHSENECRKSRSR